METPYTRKDVLYIETGHSNPRDGNGSEPDAGQYASVQTHKHRDFINNFWLTHFNA